MSVKKNWKMKESNHRRSQSHAGWTKNKVVDADVFAIALLLMLSSEVLVSAVWNLKKFSVLEQIMFWFK